MQHLKDANLELERLRFGMRLAKDLHHLDFSRYEYAARCIDEIGRLVGGWIKSHAMPPATAPARNLL